MKARFLTCILMGFLVFACATCRQQAGLSEKDIAAIRQVTDQATKMGVDPNVDWGAYVSFYYTEDAKVMMPGMPILDGREVIKAAYASMGTIQDEQWITVSIEGRDDLAYQQLAYTYTVIPPGMSAPVTEKGNGIVVWKKQDDGTWKAARDIWNSDTPPAGLLLPAGGAKPDSGPELERLGLLVGSWKLGGESKGSPFIPPGKISATLDCQWFSGGSQLVCLYNMMYPNGPVQELSIYGYDPETKAYWNYDMDSTGLSGFGKVVIQKDVWTHVWDFKVGGQAVRLQLVLSDVTPTACTWKNYYSMGGGPWTPIAEGTGTKVK